MALVVLGYETKVKYTFYVIQIFANTELKRIWIIQLGISNCEMEKRVRIKSARIKANSIKIIQSGNFIGPSRRQKGKLQILGMHE